MGRPYLSYTDQNPLDLEKLNKKAHNPNLKSLRAFLLSTFLYISVFYVFNLSPSALFCTTKFWFIMSNTLILIIAADFDAFSSTKDHSLYDENNNHPIAKISSITSTTHVPSFEIIEYPRVDQKPKYEEEEKKKKKKRVDERRSERQEKIIAMIEGPGLQGNKTETSFEKDQLIEKNKVKVICKSSGDGTDQKGEHQVKRRRLKQVTFGDIYNMHDDELESSDENGDDEFARMSNEEVNRRVEDFIRRFNNQIRLQAATYRRRQHSELQHHHM